MEERDVFLCTFEVCNLKQLSLSPFFGRKRWQELALPPGCPSPCRAVLKTEGERGSPKLIWGCCRQPGGDGPRRSGAAGRDRREGASWGEVEEGRCHRSLESTVETLGWRPGVRQEGYGRTREETTRKELANRYAHKRWQLIGYMGLVFVTWACGRLFGSLRYRSSVQRVCAVGFLGFIA
jgi:hypothetical protein